MAYTARELIAAYTAAAEARPDEAMTAALEALAARSRAGELGDAEALTFVMLRADVISAVTGEVLRFFNGRPPRRIDVDPVAEAVGEAHRSSPFSAQNRLIAFAAELGLGQGRRVFEAAYGAMGYPAFAAAAYEALIGADSARAAGYDPKAAIADTERRFESFLALLRTPEFMDEEIAPEDEPLAVKAATVGYLLCEGIKWDLGAAARRASAHAHERLRPAIGWSASRARAATVA